MIGFVEVHLFYKISDVGPNRTIICATLDTVIRHDANRRQNSDDDNHNKELNNGKTGLFCPRLLHNTLMVAFLPNAWQMNEKVRPPTEGIIVKS